MTKNGHRKKDNYKPIVCEYPRPLQRGRARTLVSGAAGRLFEHREAGEFLPAPKKAFARGKPTAKLQGRLLLVLFLAPRKVQTLLISGGKLIKVVCT